MSRLNNNNRKKRNKELHVAEELAEVLAKIQLIEGDRKAFADSSQFTAKNNDAKIAALKRENRELIRKYKTCMSCDDETLNIAFKGHDIGKQAYVGKLPDDTITDLNLKKCDQMNRLNLVQYQTRQKEKELTELAQKMKDLHDFAEQIKKDDQNTQSQKWLNRAAATELEKHKLKNTEADEVNKYFSMIVERLKEENNGYEGYLDYLDQAIKENEDELRGLQEMHRDAENSKEAAKLDLQIQEDQIAKEKFARERKKNEIKKVGDMRQSQADKLNSLISRQTDTQVEEDEDSDIVREQEARAEDAEKRISKHEQASEKIRNATGLNSTGEAIEHFKNQFTKKKSLEDQLQSNAQILADLEQKKRDMQQNYEDLKYEGTDDGNFEEMSSGHAESASQFDVDKARMSITEKKLQDTQATVSYIKSAIEHLHSKLPKGTAPNMPMMTNSGGNEIDSLIDLLNICEQKIRELVAVTGKDTDVDGILREIDDSEFHLLVQDKMPQANERVSIKKVPREANYEEILESDEDEDILTRTAVKRASKTLIDSRTNRRGNKKALMNLR